MSFVSADIDVPDSLTQVFEDSTYEDFGMYDVRDKPVSEYSASDYANIALAINTILDMVDLGTPKALAVAILISGDDRFDWEIVSESSNNFSLEGYTVIA
jgi:hypothetical protein